MDIQTYRYFLEEIEDAYDVLLIRETRNDERISWSELKSEFEYEGRL